MGRILLDRYYSLRSRTGLQTDNPDGADKDKKKKEIDNNNNS